MSLTISEILIGWQSEKRVLTRMCRPYSAVLRRLPTSRLSNIYDFCLSARRLDFSPRSKFIQSSVFFSPPDPLSRTPSFVVDEKKFAPIDGLQDEKSIKLMRDTGLARSHTHTLGWPACEWSGGLSWFFGASHVVKSSTCCSSFTVWHNNPHF